MECPRCGNSLSTLTLGGRRAVVCEGCEYVGVPTDHSPAESEEEETWDDALDRFRSRV